MLKDEGNIQQERICVQADNLCSSGKYHGSYCGANLSENPARSEAQCWQLDALPDIDSVAANARSLSSV
jgi:hypothetical protein